MAALHAHAGQHDAWLALVGDLLYTAGTAGGERLTTALQASTHPTLATTPDYDPDATDQSPNDVTGLAAFIAAQQPVIASGVQDHTRGMLADALAYALTSGQHTSQHHPTAPLSDAVNTLYDQWTGQSDTTDSDFAAALSGDWTALGWNHGEYDALAQATAGSDAQSGVQRTWNAVGDAHTRPEHAEADGQTVGLHENFTVGGEDLMYPCDPSASAAMTYNCRCSVSYSINGVATTGDDSVDEGA